MFNEVDASETEDVKKTTAKKHKVHGKGKSKKKKGGKKKHHSKKKVAAKKA